VRARYRQFALNESEPGLLLGREPTDEQPIRAVGRRLRRSPLAASSACSARS